MAFKWDERSLTTTQIVEAYFRRLITREDYVTAMDARGITEENAILLTQVRESQLSTSQALSLFRKGVLDYDQAMLHLVKAGYPEEKAILILDTAYQDLTRSEIIALFVQGHITVEQTIERLQQKGYPNTDIPYLFDLAQNYPGKTDIRKMYELGMLNEQDVKDYFARLGYSPRYVEYATLLLTQERLLERLKEFTEWMKTALLVGSLTELNFTRYAASMGYTDEEIEMMLQEVSIRKDIETRYPGTAYLPHRPTT